MGRFRRRIKKNALLSDCLKEKKLICNFLTLFLLRIYVTFLNLPFLISTKERQKPKLKRLTNEFKNCNSMWCEKKYQRF